MPIWKQHELNGRGGRAADSNGRTLCTVFLAKNKSCKLEPLAFYEYCRFDTSAFFIRILRIKRASLYTHKESRSIMYQNGNIDKKEKVSTSDGSVFFSIPI